VNQARAGSSNRRRTKASPASPPIASASWNVTSWSPSGRDEKRTAHAAARATRVSSQRRGCSQFGAPRRASRPARQRGGERGQRAALMALHLSEGRARSRHHHLARIDRGALITSAAERRICCSDATSRPPHLRQRPSDFVRSIVPVRGSDPRADTRSGVVARSGTGAPRSTSRTLLTEVRLRNDDTRSCPDVRAGQVQPVRRTPCGSSRARADRALGGAQVVDVRRDGTCTIWRAARPRLDNRSNRAGLSGASASS